jgi:tryptophanase
MNAEEHSDADEEIPSTMELVRLAIPHRVYTQSHIDYVIEAILQVYERRETIGGYQIISQPKFLRHFTARFESVDVLTNLETVRSNHGEPVLLHN